MSTVAQIIAYADLCYENDVSDANCILHLDRIHKRVYEKIIRLKNIYKDETGYTVANQLTYTLPTDCLPENIIKIQISGDITGSVDANTVWQTYERASLSQHVSSGYYWHNISDTVIIITKDGNAIDISNYEIRYYYYPNPASISLTTQTPDLDSQYHDILEYLLIQAIASQGANPDTIIANYYQAKADERMKTIEESLSERYADAPIEDNQLGSRW